MFDGGVVAVAARNVEVFEVIWYVEKHVLRLIQPLKAGSVVWKLVARIRG